MENKKILKFLLKDLSELDELFAEKTDAVFDELEMEFLQNRISGAKKLVEVLVGREGEITTLQAAKNLAEKMDNPTQVEVIPVNESRPEKETPTLPIEDEKEQDGPQNPLPAEAVEKVENLQKEVEREIKEERIEQRELEMEDEDTATDVGRRLGDSFLQKNSVNDILATENANLEHKLSNRPVASIRAAIGINDRFQYIRELFDGSGDTFGKTVADIDSMDDIKQAVEYLQQNFKWKKNETSLKFVNLVKRRFAND